MQHYSLDDDSHQAPNFGKFISNTRISFTKIGATVFSNISSSLLYSEFTIIREEKEKQCTSRQVIVKQKLQNVFFSCETRQGILQI